MKLIEMYKNVPFNFIEDDTYSSTRNMIVYNAYIMSKTVRLYHNSMCFIVDFIFAAL